MKVLFIVNPVAGKGRAKEIAGLIRERFERTSAEYRMEMTEKAGDATRIAREAAEAEPGLRVFAVGGDGTVNEVVNGLVGTTAMLGILPCGSGNDTLRSLSGIKDPLILLESMLDAVPAKFDVGCLNGRHFINIASVGFDAEVVRLSLKFRRFRFVTGPMAYMLGVLAALVRRPIFRIRLSVDGGPTADRPILLAAFANGRYYGGGFQPAPMASMQDGRLHLCSVWPLSRLRILKFFPRFRAGRHLDLKEVTITPFSDLVLKSDSILPVNMDGELSQEREIHIQILPDAIQLLVP